MSEESGSRNWIDEFFEVVRPVRERCVLARRRLQKPWMERRWLSRELVERQQESGLMLAYYAREGGRDWVAVDVDDHEDGGWRSGRPTEKLRVKAVEVLERMGREPSVAFATPRGVHLYWFMTRAVPEDVIVRVMDRRVEGIAEHRPTTKDALRVPDAARCVNGALEPTVFEGFGSMKRWNPEEVLGADCEMRPRTIEDMRKRYRRVEEVGEVEGEDGTEGNRIERGHAGTGLRVVGLEEGSRHTLGQSRAEEPEVHDRVAGGLTAGLSRIEAEENAEVPLRNSHTNTAYRHLVGLYYAAGLSQEEAIGRFRVLIERSPGYTGPLKGELERRVGSSYSNLRPVVSEVGVAWRNLTEDPEARAVVESIIDAVGLPERSRGRGSLEKILWGLWKRKLQNDWIVEDPLRLEAQERQYPGYKMLRDEGFYPVSSLELQDLVHRYKPYVAMLIGIGVMAPSERKYKPGLRCLYYNLHINAFKVLRGNSIGPVGSLTVTRVG